MRLTAIQSVRLLLWQAVRECVYVRLCHSLCETLRCRLNSKLDNAPASSGRSNALVVCYYSPSPLATSWLLLVRVVNITLPLPLSIFVAFIHSLNHSCHIHTYIHIYCSIHQELLTPECASSASKSPTSTCWCVGCVVIVAMCG